MYSLRLHHPRGPAKVGRSRYGYGRFTIGSDARSRHSSWRRRSDAFRSVERFTVDPDGKNLTATVTVEDPDTFNEPLTMVQRWFKVNAPVKQTVCAENNFDYFSQGLFQVPQADEPDF
jgi:hypothetical protein